MKELLEHTLKQLSSELESLISERESLFKRDKEIEIRLHQLAGSIYEIEKILNQVNQSSSQPLEKD